MAARDKGRSIPPNPRVCPGYPVGVERGSAEQAPADEAVRHQEEPHRLPRQGGQDVVHLRGHAAAGDQVRGMETVLYCTSNRRTVSRKRNIRIEK